MTQPRLIAIRRRHEEHADDARKLREARLEETLRAATGRAMADFRHDKARQETRA